MGKARLMLTAPSVARKLPFSRKPDLPDLESQLEELLIEVWRQEEFERKHPFTCAVIREVSRSRSAPRLEMN